MASQIDIVNLALSHIGQKEWVADLNENSSAAQAVKTVWTIAVRKVLRDAPWRFARRFATMATLASSPTTDWLYAYQQPSDCLVPRRVVAATGALAAVTRLEASPQPFSTMSTGSGMLVLCDKTPATLEYTAYVPDTAQWSDDFTMAFSLYLASLLAMPLAIKADLRGQLGKEYDKALADAQANMANEYAPETNPLPCEFIAVRG